MAAQAIKGRQPAHQLVGRVYRKTFDTRRERLLVSALSFVLTFGIVRLITNSIHLEIGPFRNVQAGGVHVHHLVWGILLLLLVGYLWLLQLGTGVAGSSRPTSLVTATLFGVGAALTLDEFALWFYFADVYWQRQGRSSVDAVIIFGTLLWIGFLAGPFTAALSRELGMLRRGRASQRGRPRAG